MGWDPNTGMWTPDVERQPLGALGSVMNFHNSIQAKNISDQLQAQREAQTATEQEKLSHEQEQGQYERQMHQALQDLPPDASDDQFARTIMRTGPNPAAGLPYFRSAMTSANSYKKGVDVQKLKNASAMAKDLLDKGVAPSDVEGYLRQAGADDDTIEGLRSVNQLPTVTAGIAKTEEETNLAGIRGEDIEATRQARIDLMSLTGQSRRDLANARAKLMGGAKFGPKEEAGILGRIASNYKAIEAIESKRDQMTMKLGAVDQNNLKELRENTEELKSILESARSGSYGAAQGEPTGSAPAPSSYDPTDPLGHFSKPQ